MSVVVKFYCVFHQDKLVPGTWYIIQMSPALSISNHITAPSMLQYFE